MVPAVELSAAAVLFLVTYSVDKAAARGDVVLPSWVVPGSADAARQILTALAAAVITVIGLVFSITIVALTLASTQFGPRMLRNFIRDRGTQVTLGTFVATFLYAILTLGSVAHGNVGTFVPHLSITVALALVLADVGVLIFFIHHMATSIQLPQVIAGIAGDLTDAIDREVAGDHRGDVAEAGPSEVEIRYRLEIDGVPVAATTSGYLQFVGYETLTEIASAADAVIELFYLPGHFVVEGLPLARVWPADAAPRVARGLERAHVTGAHRTLAQDLAFAIDQLVEIAIRALSPAVNDTFTAITCVDWLGDALCKITAKWNPRQVERDRHGNVRVIAVRPSYARFVNRAYDKIRQAGRGMPAIMIRQLNSLAKVVAYTKSEEQREALFSQARMIMRACEESVPEVGDRADVRRSFDSVVAPYEAARLEGY